MQGKVVEAFEVFDHENNKTVDVREVVFLNLSFESFTQKILSLKVGTIVRSLGHCPSESQLQEAKVALTILFLPILLFR